MTNTHANKKQETQSQPAAKGVSQSADSHQSAIQLVDNRPGAAAQRRLQNLANSSGQVKQFNAFREKAATSARARQQPPVQKRENNTGLPDNLKSGIENLSGFAMDDVKVHYNSAEPAQLHAHAYAQGSDIHVAPGQEKHLAHEAWHVVQQKQGRVKPTMQLAAFSVNDDASLEREADNMGAQAMQSAEHDRTPVKLQESVQATGQPRQMYMEFLMPVAKYLGVESTITAVAAALGISPGILLGGLIGLGTVAIGWSMKKIIDTLTNKKPPLHHENMSQNRGLKEYEDALWNPDGNGPGKGQGLRHILPGLTEHDTWVDMGAGAGKALKKHYDNKKDANETPPRMIGVLVDKPKDFALDDEGINKDKLSYKQRFLEDIKDEELGGTNQVSLITDNSGVASYTEDLPGTILRYINLLKPGGNAIIRIQNTTGNKFTQDQFALNTFKKSGEEVSPDVWLSEGTGFTVSCYKGGKAWIITLTRTAGKIKIPKLKLTKYDHSNQPPIREFEF